MTERLAGDTLELPARAKPAAAVRLKAAALMEQMRSNPMVAPFVPRARPLDHIAGGALPTPGTMDSFATPSARGPASAFFGMPLGGDLLPEALRPARFLPALRSYSGVRHRETRRVDGPATLGRIGPLEVRLARTAAEVRRAQRLRYEVFYEEMSATPATAARLARRDFDAFDAICDHMLVLDHEAGRTVLGRFEPKVVGTYRLLRQDVAARHGGFYTASEFDIGPLLARHPGRRFLELGRSCVLAPYRTKRTVELLWHGVWAYARRHGIDVMFGCASLEGTDPATLARPLAFLHHYAPADAAWNAPALPARAVAMDRVAKDALDPKAAMVELPPLIKGYLRLGAQIGESAVVDRQFGTTDVLIVLPVERISPRYLDHFGVNADRHAA